MAQIYDSILEAIGNTPMVRFRRVGRSTGCEILAKCEFMNPGVSVKDRIGRRMVEEAQKSGRIKPGDTLVFHLELISPIRRGLVNMRGRGYVQGKLVSEAEMLAQIVKDH